MVRCAAVVLSGKKCKNKVTTETYCAVHRRAYKAVDVNQQDKIEYHTDYDGPGLVEDAWFEVAQHVPFEDLPRVYLTCKTLLNSFSTKYFEKYTRYLLIRKSSGYRKRALKLPGIPFEDQISTRVRTGSFRTSDAFIVDDFLYENYGNGVRRSPSLYKTAITVVKDYMSAKIVFRSLSGRIRKQAYSIWCEGSSDNIIPRVITRATVALTRKLDIMCGRVHDGTYGDNTSFVYIPFYYSDKGHKLALDFMESLMKTWNYKLKYEIVQEDTDEDDDKIYDKFIISRTSPLPLRVGEMERDAISSVAPKGMVRGRTKKPSPPAISM